MALTPDLLLEYCTSPWYSSFDEAVTQFERCTLLFPAYVLDDSIKKLNRQMPKYKAHYFGKNLTKRQLCGVIA